jgi:hypothetical protein
VGILIFKELTARRLYKSFGVKGLNKLVERALYVMRYSNSKTSSALYVTNFRDWPSILGPGINDEVTSLR